MKVLAKPSGLSLKRHTSNVIDEGNKICEAYPHSMTKYEKLIGKDLKVRVKVACEYHDTGKKISKKWQQACQEDYQDFVIWEKKTGRKGYDKYSILAKEKKNSLLNTGVRHEFFSLEHHKKENNIPLPIKVAIAAHHNKLSYRNSNRWIEDENGRFNQLWVNFQKESNKFIEAEDLPKLIKKQYEIGAVRGLLRLADHRASALEEEENLPTIKPFSYEFPHPQKRPVQKIIDDHWKDNLLLVRAPTGAGKTDTALLWAQKQIEDGRADRLLIAMPTRFTSNALSISISENLSQTGLYHSSAWFTQFSEKVEKAELEKREADSILEFARLLLPPVTVSTIDHLLTSLTLTREDHHLITFNLFNSCVVIDEADFYDEFTLANILVLLEILAYMKVPVLLMSATLPESTLSLYGKTGYNVKKIHEDTSDNERIRFRIEDIKNVEQPEDLSELLSKMIKNGSGIIYMNTIERAFLIREWFKNKGYDNVELYHSRFTEPDKALKEKRLIEMLGKDSWQKNQASGIAILTQIGEMSINISSNLMISDLCPIDRLTQRAGRLCRFNNEIGQLYIAIPYKKSSIYPAPYGSYDSKSKTWGGNEPFEKTKKLLQVGEYSAANLVTMMNNVYDKIIIDADASQNAGLLKKMYQYNWLIVPNAQTTADSTETSFWRSRNIPPQETIYVEEPESAYFSDYLRWQNWKIKNSIELPVYLFEKMLKNGSAYSITVNIREESEKIFIVQESYYSSEKGVNLSAFAKNETDTSFEII